jgi:DNA mismatch repair protein MutS2
VLRVRAKLSDLIFSKKANEIKPNARQDEKYHQREKSKENENKTKREFLTDSPGFELDLRGKRADEAVEILDEHLDSAFLVGLPFVRIIHGKGTGRLRNVVRNALNENSLVISFEGGGEMEGGEGVTVAKLQE